MTGNKPGMATRVAREDGTGDTGADNAAGPTAEQSEPVAAAKRRFWRKSSALYVSSRLGPMKILTLEQVRPKMT